jgi:hypothetical protein
MFWKSFNNLFFIRFQIHSEFVRFSAGHQRFSEGTERDYDNCKWYDDLLIWIKMIKINLD